MVYTTTVSCDLILELHTRAVFLLELLENMPLQPMQHLAERHRNYMPLRGTSGCDLPVTMPERSSPLFSSPCTRGLMRVSSLICASCMNNCFHTFPQCEKLKKRWVAKTKRANSKSARAVRRKAIVGERVRQLHNGRFLGCDGGSRLLVDSTSTRDACMPTRDNML